MTVIIGVVPEGQNLTSSQKAAVVKVFQSNQLLQPGMLKSQFVLTCLSDFFWVVYHSDRDQIMCSQTPCNNFQALQMVSSVFHFQF